MTGFPDPVIMASGIERGAAHTEVDGAFKPAQALAGATAPWRAGESHCRAARRFGKPVEFRTCLFSVPKAVLIDLTARAGRGAEDVDVKVTKRR